MFVTLSSCFNAFWLIEIVERVKYPSLVGGYFRPPIKNLNIPDYVRQCLMLCWEEEPEERYA